ncbi:MAG: hypothetical protein NC311_01895 [Muribaculaceae bacterium]|nr:hypothetical protein [Muribaculaceae bacterium]
MKTKILLISCMAMLCTDAFGDCGSENNLCYANNMKLADGSLYRRGYYYEGASHTPTYVNKIWVQGCADGYYMPSNAPRPKCTGGTITLAGGQLPKDVIKIDECCWPCPFLDQDESYQQCYRIIYGTDAYVSQCDLDWCRGSVSGKNPYGGINTCQITPEDTSDLPVGGDKTGEYVMTGACRFTGLQTDVDNQCDCYPRTDYANQYCAG